MADERFRELLAKALNDLRETENDLMLSKIRALQFEIELIKLKKRTAWISVEDRLPEKNDWVIVYPGSYPEYEQYQSRTLAYLNKNGVWINCHESRRASPPTHWMPKPPPPDKEVSDDNQPC